VRASARAVDGWDNLNTSIYVMPQLMPFYFVNQISFTFLTLLILIYVFSKYILPSMAYQQVVRLYITKLTK